MVYLPDWIFKPFLHWERSFKKIRRGGKLLARSSQKLNNNAGVPWLGSLFLQTNYFTHLSRTEILPYLEEDTEPHGQSAAQKAWLSLSGCSRSIHDIFISYGKSKPECLWFNCSLKTYQCAVSHSSPICLSEVHLGSVELLVEETGKSMCLSLSKCWDWRISHWAHLLRLEDLSPRSPSQAELADWVLV